MKSINVEQRSPLPFTNIAQRLCSTFNIFLMFLPGSILTDTLRNQKQNSKACTGFCGRFQPRKFDFCAASWSHMIPWERIYRIRIKNHCSSNINVKQFIEQKRTLLHINVSRSVILKPDSIKELIFQDNTTGEEGESECRNDTYLRTFSLKKRRKSPTFALLPIFNLHFQREFPLRK